MRAAHVMVQLLKRILLVTTLCLSAKAFAGEPAPHCETFSAPLKGGFCLSIPAKPNGDIVYFLHGKGGSEFDWFKDYHYGQQLKDLWSRGDQLQPIIVTISFGPIWLLAAQNASPYSGLFEAFTKLVMPKIESALGGLKGRRILVGGSMGAVNSVQLAFKTELFSKAAILCAPMAEVSPFASADEIRAYAESTLAHSRHKETSPTLVFDTMMQAAELSRAFFPTPQDWEGGNPLSLVNHLPPNRAELYVAIGVYDKYGAYEANVKLVEQLNKQKVKYEWRPQYGDHCAIDILSLSEFILKK